MNKIQKLNERDGQRGKVHAVYLNEMKLRMREGNSKAVMPLTQERTYWKESVYSSELRGIRLSRHHREIEEASALDRENHVHAPTGEFGTPGLARHVLEEKLVRFLIVQTLAKALQASRIGQECSGELAQLAGHALACVK